MSKHSPAIKEIYCHCLANYVISHYILNNLKETNLNARNKRLIFPIPWHVSFRPSQSNWITDPFSPKPYDFSGKLFSHSFSLTKKDLFLLHIPYPSTSPFKVKLPLTPFSLLLPKLKTTLPPFSPSKQIGAEIKTN